MSSNQPNSRIMNLSIHDLTFINASAFNVLLPLLVVLFIRVVPQANHIVFSKIADIDPISTTGLVILYTIFTMFIYYSQEEKYLNFNTNKLDLSIVFQKVNLISSFIPLLIWLLAILTNYRNRHFFSILFTVLFMISLIALIRSGKKYQVLVHSSISYLVYMIALALLMYGAYVFNDFSEGKYTFLIPIFLYIFLAMIIFVIMFLIDNRIINSRFLKVTSSILIITIVILFSVGFRIIYTPVNILLLYVLIIRICIIPFIEELSYYR